MVWKSIHLDLDQLIKPAINIQTTIDIAEDGFAVGIVGAGPKGLYALERLCRQLVETGQQTPVNIYWFNESNNFGTGPNYQVDQDEYLLINYALGNIDVWDRRTEHSYIPDRPTFREWIQRYSAVAEHVSPYDFASRALVGRYLQDMLHKVCSSAPSYIQIHCIRGQVEMLDGQDDARISLHFGEQHLQLDSLIFCTGHCYDNSPIHSTQVEFKKMGLSVADIAKGTGLTVAEINEL